MQTKLIEDTVNTHSKYSSKRAGVETVEKELTYLHIFIDKTNEKLLKTEKIMRDYQRLMLSSVAHEFRNPLNAIKGSLELISMLTQEPKCKKFVSTAMNSSIMLNSYVDDILDLGRIEGGGFELNPQYFYVRVILLNQIDI